MEQALSYGITVAGQVVILFVLIFVGYLAGKFKLLKREGVNQMIDLLLYIVTPAVIVNAFATVDYNKDTIGDFLFATLCAVLTHAVGIVFALLFCKVKNIDKQSVYRNCIIFSNGGFMAIPLVFALAGEYGVFLVSPYIITINVLSWIYGVRLFPKGKSAGKIKAVLNPGTVGVLLGLPLFLFVDNLPITVSQPIEYLASLNTPIAMLVTGYFLIGSDVIGGLKDIKLWSVSTLRLVVIPLIMLLIFKVVFSLSGELLIAVAVPACAPCAVSNMMLSAKFGGDTSLASRLISFTTILSMLTMPILLALTQI
ncbi:MAG: AEC family transporter [Clostridia bacterium]|nr:AEC family transporter [Clostridia bacterium]